jgi:hypothetical protein
MPGCGARYTRDCPEPADCYEWEHDGDAWAYLESRGYTSDRFLIMIPKGHVPSAKEYAAMCYLFSEWDWDVRREKKDK